MVEHWTHYFIKIKLFYFRLLSLGWLVKISYNSLSCCSHLWTRCLRIVHCDVKHTVSVSFWSLFRQDIERLLFLISPACNGSDSWCEKPIFVCCNRAAVSHRYCTCSSLDTPHHRLSSWLLPRWKYSLVYSIPLCESLKALGFLGSSCRGRVSHLSCQYTKLSDKFIKAKIMRIISHKSSSTHASSDHIQFLCTMSNFEFVMS